MKTTKLFEVGTEGGALSIFRTENELKEVWFYYTVKEMGLKEEDIPPVNKTSSQYTGFHEAFVSLLHHYRVFYFFPLVVVEEYKKTVFYFLKAFLSTEDVGYFNKEQWEAVLGFGFGLAD